MFPVKDLQIYRREYDRFKTIIFTAKALENLQSQKFSLKCRMADGFETCIIKYLRAR